MNVGHSAVPDRRSGPGLLWPAIGALVVGLAFGFIQPLFVVGIGAGIYAGPTWAGLVFLLCVAAMLLFGAVALLVRNGRELSVPLALSSGCVALGMFGGNWLAAGLHVSYASPRPPTTIQPTGQGWSTTGSLLVGRSQHTATVLLDGRVLVAGGMGAKERLLSSAELYDPRTGAWTATGGMLAPQTEDTAVRLADGRVLAMTYNGSTSIYDPGTGAWTAATSMRTPRIAFAATLLRDGRVLVSGGRNPAIGFEEELAPAELYDPATGSWTETGPMHERRTSHSATLLRDGRVLVAGGQGSETSEANPMGFLKSAEIFAPTTGTWAEAPAMQGRHSGHAAVLLADGRVLVSGSPVDTFGVELYDPVARRWEAGGKIDGWMRPQANLLADGRILIVDGDGGFEVYDPSTATSTRVARAGHGFGATATQLPDGRVLVAGGMLIHYGEASEFLTAAHLFGPR